MIWLYTSEVVIDSAGGLIVFGVFGLLLIQSLTLEVLIDKFYAHGVFIMFGFITFSGLFYILIFIKETAGLSDKEKKSLYRN